MRFQAGIPRRIAEILQDRTPVLTWDEWSNGPTKDGKEITLALASQEIDQITTEHVQEDEAPRATQKAKHQLM